MRKMLRAVISGVAGSLLLAVAGPAAASAATVVVTPANTQGWSTADTRPGGAVTFVSDPTSPAPPGALQLTTDLTTTAKAQYLHAASTPLSAVTELTYYTKQVFGPPAFADPSYQLPTYVNRTTGFTTLVFEPYENPGNNGNLAILPDAWQKWDVATGRFYSTRTVTCSNGTLVGSQGANLYTLAALKATCPSAVVIGFGVNIGSNNPGYNVRTDLFDFNGTTYNFELTNVPTDKKQCRNGGYVNYTDANGQPFKNQGQCIASAKNSDNGGDQQGQHGGDGQGNQGADGQDMQSQDE